MNGVNLWGATLWRFEPGEKGTRIVFFMFACAKRQNTRREVSFNGQTSMREISMLLLLFGDTFEG